MPFQNPPSSCQPAKLKVGEIASEIGYSTRQLARLAKNGVPGVKKGAGKYQFIWLDIPETRAWIEDRKRFRKGNRKQPAKRKERLSKPQLFARLIRKIEKQVSAYLETALEKPTASGLDELKVAAQRLDSIGAGVWRRISRAGDNLGRRKGA